MDIRPINAQIMPIVTKLVENKVVTGAVNLVVLLMIVSFLPSCNRKSPFEVNISSVKAEPVSIKRYEQVLFTIDPKNLRVEIDPFITDFEIFLGQEINTLQGQQQLVDYVSNPFNRDLFNDVNVVWQNVSELEKQLAQLFRYLRYHFPEIQNPQVYTYVSGVDFEFPVYFEDGILVIALDMFLGRGNINYDKAGLPAFKRTRFVPEAVVTEVARAIGRHFLYNTGNRPENLLDFMVNEGKLLYFIDAMLPSVSDSLKMYYTTHQLQWAQNNEGHAWAFLLNNEMLYSADRQLIQKLTGDAPFTSLFSTVSAPRMGTYNGWQIVRGYMTRNRGVSLQELLNIKDSREILSGSRYRP